jgi:hypothetical protein
MEQRRKSIRRKSLRRKSLRRNNRTTLKRGDLKRGGVTPDVSTASKKRSYSQIDPSSDEASFPRTEEQWDKAFKYEKSLANRERTERVSQASRKEKLDKHMRRIPEIIHTYGARDIQDNVRNGPYITLTKPNNQYYFDILGIPLKRACSISNAELKAKYEDIINHNHLHKGLQKFVDDAKNKLYNQDLRKHFANDIPWQEHQLKVREYEKNQAKFLSNPGSFPEGFFPVEPSPYEHKTLC